MYVSLSSQLQVTSSGERRLLLANETDSRKLHGILRDLTSSLQALGRLVDHFLDEKFEQTFQDAHALVSK